MSTAVKLFPARPASAAAIGQGTVVNPQLVVLKLNNHLKSRQRVRVVFSDHTTVKGTVHISKRHHLAGVWLDEQSPVAPAHIAGIDSHTFPIGLHTAGSSTRQLVADKVDAFLEHPAAHHAGAGFAVVPARVRSPFCWILPGLPFCHH
jgi:hypothetical protein